MASDRKVQDTVAQLAGTFGKDPIYFTICEVVSVDANSRTCDCTPIGGDAVTDIPNVMLMSEVNDGLLLIPALNSTVIVCYSNKNVPYIAMYSELDNVFLIANNGIQLQGGEYGGLIIIQSLIEKINNLENLCNELSAKYNIHTHVLALSSGTGTAAPTETQEDTILTPTVKADIENTSITHGA